MEEHDMFLLGAATAAHQVEGNNHNSDCWVLENLEHSTYAEKSGAALDHYHRYREDIKFLADAGLNTYRFSIEWARIEPSKGTYNDTEIEHYRDVLLCCKENGITPVVTMHHFSSPKWLIEEGGWENEKVVDYFAAYCAYVVSKIGMQMKYICTINEANMRVQLSAITRTFLQNMGGNIQVGVKLELPEEMMIGQREASEAFGGVEEVSTFLSGCTEDGDILIGKAHMAARDAMKQICPHLKIGMTLSLHDIQTIEGGQKRAAEIWNEEFLHYLPYIKGDDFFGLQNYTRNIIDANGEVPVDEAAKKTQMGYEFYPEALEHVIRSVAKEISIPILITENGVAVDDDKERIDFIQTALAGVKKCIRDDIPVIGYCYWSLLDNFEWQMGFSKTFGLIAVDRKTQVRYPKDSLYMIKKLWNKK